MVENMRMMFFSEIRGKMSCESGKIVSILNYKSLRQREITNKINNTNNA